MKEAAEKIFRVMYAGTPEEVQQYIDALEACEKLETDDRKELLHLGLIMIDEKKAEAEPTPPKKRGRPGSKNRKDVSDGE